MQNSGIVLERVTGEEGALESAPPCGSSPQPLGDGPPELPLLEVEQMETVGVCVAGMLLPGAGSLYLVTTLACAATLPRLYALLSTVTLSTGLFTAFPGAMREPKWGLGVGMESCIWYRQDTACSGCWKPACVPLAGGQ
jgi:hypothetical protein